MSSFNPYTDNGGSCLAISGPNFCIVACDSRQSEGYLINSRREFKIFKLNNSTFITLCGFQADCKRFYKAVMDDINIYIYQNQKNPSLSSIAQLISILLYSKRFFPYYTYVILAGFDEDGKGAIFSYDPVGSYEKEKYRSYGSASTLLQPFLDSLIPRKNDLLLDEVNKIVIDAFVSAAERDIHTGDSCKIVTSVSPDFIGNDTIVQLRRD